MSIKLIRYGNQSYTSDHEYLTSRDKEDQHPIFAITGLEEKLEIIDNNIKNIGEQLEWSLPSLPIF